MFEKQFHVAWAHLDANGHMANTAYLDIVVDVRFMYFESCGFGPAEFRKHAIGPVVRRDEVDYLKELHLLEAFKVTLAIAGLAEDGSRFKLRNEIIRADNQVAARITTLGGWFDLKARKLVAPPEVLAASVRNLSRTEDYEVLKSSVR